MIPEFQTHDYPIGGKMIVATATMEDSYLTMIQDGNPEAVKRIKTELAMQLATYMIEKNLLEFTKFMDPVAYTTTIRLRAYLAPNDQVKILRLANKI